MKDFDLEQFPTSEAAKRMMSYISEEFYEKSYVMKWIQQVMGLEWDDALRILETELPKQFFPETATWGLKYHEEKWQLPVRENLPIEQRRKLIYAQRDYVAPMTPYAMEQYLEKVTGFDVRIEDCHDHEENGFIPEHPNQFKVTFTGQGTLDVSSAKKMIKKLKQSHTTYCMTEQVLIEFNHYHLEIVELESLMLQTAIFYWSALAEKRLLSANVEIKTAIQTIKESIQCGMFLFGNILCRENVDVDTIAYCFPILNADLMPSDRAYTHTKMIIKGIVSKLEENIERCEVITHRNFWPLDGSYCLDGTRNLNAEEIKEVL